MNNGQQLTDLSKEAAIAGCVAEGSFELIPESALIPEEAFVDPAWRLIYSIARKLRGTLPESVLCYYTVNDYIAFHGLDVLLQKAFDSANISSWKNWPERADKSIAQAPLLAAHCLSELARLHRIRLRRQIGARLVEGVEEEDFLSVIAELQSLNHQNNGHVLRSLMDFSEMEINEDDTLLGNRFLCREGGMLFVGPSGMGKTAASAQQDALWSIGKPAFDIQPCRALKILTIQAEDDDGDMIEISKSLRSALQFSTEDVALSKRNCIYIVEKTHTGARFLNDVVAPLLAQHHPDILRINPFQAYLGGDIMNPEITGAFLRTGLNPLLQKYRCAVIIVHHTPKITNRDTTVWKASDWMYAGAGSADITNWARAALVSDATEDPSVFLYIAAKRGARIGWVEQDGVTPTIFRYFSHSQDSIHWVPTPDDNIPEPKGKSASKNVDLVKVIELMPPLPLEVPRKNFTEEVKTKLRIGVNKTKDVITSLIKLGLIAVRLQPRSGTKPEEFLRRKETSEWPC